MVPKTGDTYFDVFIFGGTIFVLLILDEHEPDVVVIVFGGNVGRAIPPIDVNVADDDPSPFRPGTGAVQQINSQLIAGQGVRRIRVRVHFRDDVRGYRLFIILSFFN